MRTWIKICGTTSIADALASVQAGADALGFIFAASARRVTPQKAQEIIRELPPNVERIGVFMDATADEVAKTVSEVDLTGIQLHGDESAQEVYSRLPRDRRSFMRIIKTILVRDGFEQKFESIQSADSVINAWLFDSGTGSGVTFDWKVARGRLGKRERFIIAGGLNPENVGQAMAEFLPWGVDVVSGVERERGHKDHDKLKAFVAAVRKAEQQ